MWPTSAGVDRAPRSPKNTTSPGSSACRGIRAERGTSPLIAYVVLPRSILGDCGSARVRLELVDAPDEARAVEAPGQRLAEELLRALGGTRPDIRRSDEAERARDDSALHLAQVRNGEGRRGRASRLQLLGRQREHACDRVRGLGARRRLRELQLECLAVPLVVDSQAEHSRDRLGTEPRLRGEARVEGRETDLHARPGEARRAIPVEHRARGSSRAGADRRPIRIPRGSRERLQAPSRVSGSFGLNAPADASHQACSDDSVDLLGRERVRWLRRAGRAASRDEDGDDERDDEAADHDFRIGSAAAGSQAFREVNVMGSRARRGYSGRDAVVRRRAARPSRDGRGRRLRERDRRGCGSVRDRHGVDSRRRRAREAAPALSGVTLDGDAIALGDFRGRPVLINVWSSW